MFEPFSVNSDLINQLESLFVPAVPLPIELLITSNSLVVSILSASIIYHASSFVEELK